MPRLVSMLPAAHSINRYVCMCRLGAYGRATDRFRRLPATAGREELQALLAYSKELSVSYSGLLLTMDMFPQVGD